MTKVSYEAKNAYRKCISANGIMASTTKKVDNMYVSVSILSLHSTDLLWSGKFKAAS